MIISPNPTPSVTAFQKQDEPLIDHDGSNPSTLSVTNLKYKVTEWVGPWWKGACLRSRRTKVILDDINMHFNSGQITAILGNSGSGKTSLLDIIACRPCGTVEGGVYYNNKPCTLSLIRRKATYVMQADRLLPNLTVRETLRYTAVLQLPGNTTQHEINAKVDAVIQEMGLKGVADTKVGGHVIRGISGGEQRRLTIAIQLLKDPEIILLDEPTSGLDSYTARYIVSNLRDLAHRGKIVLLTIHQPSSDVFPMFDQVGILSAGRLVYLGPRRDIVSYFTRQGYPCDKYTNPLDRYVDVASIDRRDSDKLRQSTKRVETLVDAYKSSSEFEAIHRQTMFMSSVQVTQRAEWKSPLDGPNWCWIVFTLCSRMNKNLFRDRLDYLARIFLLPVFIIFVLLFLGRLKHTQDSIQDRIGLLYQASTVPPFMGILNCVGLFPSLRALYYRECRDGLYSASTFLISYTLHILPFHIVGSVIFSSVVYWVTGLSPEVERYGYFTAVVFLMHYWGEMVTVMLMAIILHPGFANSMSVLMLAASVYIASGLLKSTSTLPKPLQWISWIFIHRYCGEVFMVNEFKGLQFTCNRNDTISCMPNGDIYLDLYYPNAVKNMDVNFGALWAYDVGTLLFAILSFKLRGLRNLN